MDHGSGGVQKKMDHRPTRVGVTPQTLIYKSTTFPSNTNLQLNHFPQKKAPLVFLQMRHWLGGVRKNYFKGLQRNDTTKE